MRRRFIASQRLYVKIYRSRMTSDEDWMQSVLQTDYCCIQSIDLCTVGALVIQLGRYGQLRRQHFNKVIRRFAFLLLLDLSPYCSRLGVCMQWFYKWLYLINWLLFDSSSSIHYSLYTLIIHCGASLDWHTSYWLNCTNILWTSRCLFVMISIRIEN